MSYSVTFDGTNGSPWPGYAALVRLNNSMGGLADLQGNEGRIRLSDTGGYENRVKIARAMSPELNGNVQMTFRVPAARPDISVDLSVRGSGIQPTYQGTPATSYTLTIRPATNVIHLWRQENEATPLDIGRNDAYTMNGGDEIHVRVEATDATIRAKVWKNTETEPGTWAWSYVDAQPLPAGVDSISVRGSTTFNGGEVFFTRHTRISSTAISAPSPVFRTLGTANTAATASSIVAFAAPSPGALLVSAVGVNKSAGGAASLRVTETGWRTLGSFDSADVSGAIALKHAQGSETSHTWSKGSIELACVAVAQISNIGFSVKDAVAFTPPVDAVANLTAENSAGSAPSDGLAIAYHSVDTTQGPTGPTTAWSEGYPNFTNGYTLQLKYNGEIDASAGIAIATKYVRTGDSLATSVAINSADQAFVGIVFVPYAPIRSARSWKKPGATTATTDDIALGPRPALSTTPAVINVRALPASSQVTLTWDLPSGFVPPTSYVVGRDGSDAAGTGAWSTTLPGTQRSATFMSLINGTSYNVYVEPVANGVRGARVTRTATPSADVTTTFRDAPAQPTVAGTLPAHMIGTWSTIFEDDFDDPTVTAQKWNLNREAYHTTNGWWSQDEAGMQVPPQSDALEFSESAVWLKVTRKTNPTGKPFVNAIMTTGRPQSAYGTPCKFAIPKNSTTFTEGLLWNGTARGTLSGFWLLGNTAAGDPFDVNGNATKGFNAQGGAVWGQTTAGWPTGGEVDIVGFTENSTSERHRPFSLLHWAKDHLTNPPGTWGSREFVAHPDSSIKPRPDLQNSWHKWGLYRSPTLMVVYVDGVELCRWIRGNTYTAWDGPHAPAPVAWTGDMYLLLSYSIGGGWGGQGWTPEQLEEGRFGAKYIKVWQMASEPSNVPSAPQNLTTTATSTSATVSWQAPASVGASAITGYTVARDGTDVNGGGPWSTTITDPSVRNFTFTRLVAGRTYNLTVRAINGSGAGTLATVSVIIPGTVTLRDHKLQPFTSESVWNLPKTTDAPLEAESGPLTLAIRSGANAWANFGDFGHPISTATDADPMATVTDRNDATRSTTARIPTNALIAPGSDRHMHVLQPDGFTLLECIGVTRNSATSYTVDRVHKVNLRGTGLGPWNGVRAHGGSAIAGLIRGWEVDPTHPRYTGEIEHVIAMAATSADLLYTGDVGLNTGEYNGYFQDDVTQTFPGWNARSRRNFMKSQGYRWPATEQDYNSKDPTSGYKGPIPMGSLFCIPSTVNIDTIVRSNGTALSAQGKMLARAYQKYGGRILDRAGDVVLAYADETPAAAAFFRVLVNDPVYDALDLRAIRALLRYVTTDTETNPAGGPLNAATRPALRPPL